ncbi:hypothetical protein LguiA_009095 [Lonicera macranthoides]
MGKLTMIVLVLYFFLLAAPMTQAADKESPEEVEAWFKKLSHKKQKLTKIQFYSHNLLKGSNRTSAPVAQANTTASSPTLFGLVNIMDIPLTAGPEPSSKPMGRAQGLYASASQEETTIFHGMNLLFTYGKYNGSSLAVLGHNVESHMYRELPIVGGSGAFRLARGSVIFKTYSYDVAVGIAVLEVNVVAQHYY